MNVETYRSISHNYLYIPKCIDRASRNDLLCMNFDLGNVLFGGGGGVTQIWGGVTCF